MLREAARSKFITIIRVDGLGLRRPSGSCLCGNASDPKPHAAPPDWTSLGAFFPFLSRQKTFLIIFCLVPRLVLSAALYQRLLFPVGFPLSKRLEPFPPPPPAR